MLSLPQSAQIRWVKKLIGILRGWLVWVYDNK
jgi:hypothetical protein